MEDKSGQLEATWKSFRSNLGLLGAYLCHFVVIWGSLGVTWGSFSTSKMNLMCKVGGLDGSKIENVEKVLVFKAFLDVLLRLTGRLTGRPWTLWRHLQPLWGPLGAFWGDIGITLEHFDVTWRSFWNDF